MALTQPTSHHPLTVTPSRRREEVGTPSRPVFQNFANDFRTDDLRRRRRAFGRFTPNGRDRVPTYVTASTRERTGTPVAELPR